MKLYQNKDWLYQKYWKEDLSMGQISKTCKINPSSLLEWMQKFNIPRRTLSEAQLIYWGHRNTYQNKIWLQNKYWKDGLSTNEIAEICKVNTRTIRHWMKKLGIPIRTRSEASRGERNPMYGIIGKKCPSWIDGRAYELYPREFSNELKEKIRKRDNYQCQICGKGENGKAHDVHHKDYNKKNNKPENLITLCHSCHTKTNKYRECWSVYFETKEQFKRDAKALFIQSPVREILKWT